MGLGSLVDSGRFPYAGPAEATDGYAVLDDTDNVELLAAPGTNARIYVVSVIASNTSGLPVRIDIKDGATTKHSVYLAADGGGFSHVFTYPWRLAANSPLIVALSSPVPDVRISVNGFVLK